ncbi:ABC transporter permease [Betaproteobacteria bacterium]|nr:ABC transporter permease [Betaproteobacteria bacterium]
MSLLSLFISLIVMILVGVPVLLSLGLVGIIGIVSSGSLAPALFVQKAFAMLDSFPLLAMPFFILAGVVMSRGGLAEKLISFAQALVGHLRGSLAQVAIVACTAMANVSGSSTAEAAAIGRILIPEMKKRGYKPGFAAAVIAVAATIGPIIPPSMTAIVYGSMANVSIGGLFLAGVIPGYLLCLVLMAMIKCYSHLPMFPYLAETTKRPDMKQMKKHLLDAWAALLAPIIVLGGILSGIFTATEAGVIVTIYAFFVSFFIYRSVSLRDLVDIFVETAVITSMAVGIIAMAGPLGWLLTYMDFNNTALALIRSVTNDPQYVFLIIIAIMVFLTMFVESLSVLIVLVPVTTYLSQVYGYDPYQLGIALVISTQVGALTPPVASLLFVTTSVAETRFSETCRFIFPFIGVHLLLLASLTFFPPLASWLPHLFLG